MAAYKKKWYKMDITGKLYASITSIRVPTVFRISATLTDEVQPDKLQTALENIIERFPYFKVFLKRGLFWYYFEHTEHTPHIEEETYFPCMFMFFKKRTTFPFRVLYYKKKISCEFSHSITDGMGAVAFLKTLLSAYFGQLGIDLSNDPGIFDINEQAKLEEYEDALHKYYKKGVTTPDLPKKALHFPFRLNNKGEYHIITGIINVQDIKEQSKRYGCSITQLLLVLYFEAIQEFVNSKSDKERKSLLRRVVINVPINLRGLFPTITMRNFFVSITPSIDLRLGLYTREELVKYVVNYMALSINEKYISQFISRNVKNEKNFFLRILPLFIKNLIMPVIYHRFGESGYTSSLSNIGEITLPKELEVYVDRFEVYPPPSKGNIIKAAVTSYNGKLYISFGRLTDNTELEKYFFRRIRKLNIPVKIETNKR